MSVPNLPMVEEPPRIVVTEAEEDVPIRPHIINVEKKTSITDNWQNIDLFADGVTSERHFNVEEMTQDEEIELRRQRILQIRKRKSQERRRLGLIVISFLTLKFLLVFTCLYNPILELTPRQTYWAIISCGFALGLIISLPQKIRYLIRLRLQPKDNNPRQTRVRFAEMTEVVYINGTQNKKRYSL